MSYSPLKFRLGRAVSTAELRYCVRPGKKADRHATPLLVIHIRPELLARVKGDTLSVVLEAGSGADAGKARLTCCVQKNGLDRSRNINGGGKGEHGSSVHACWPWTGEVAEHFPQTEAVTALTVVEVTSNAIVFELPGKPAGKKAR